MSDNLTLRNIEILKPGTFFDNRGRRITISPEDLHELASSYDTSQRQAAVVIGHPKNEDFAWGWISRPRVVTGDTGPVLLADADDVDPNFADLLKKKRLKYVSASFWGREMTGNPTPGRLYLKHLGFLGAKPPAVGGLKPIQLSEDDESIAIQLSNGDPCPFVLQGIVQTLGKVRDYLIEAVGLEKADSIISSSDMQDLQVAVSLCGIDQTNNDDMETEPATPVAFSEGGKMTTTTDREAALAAKEQDLARQELSLKQGLAALSAEKKALSDRENTDFVDQMIREGRLPTSERDSVLSELSALDTSDVSIQLAEGGQVTMRDAYMKRLRRNPKLVQLGELDQGSSDTPVTFSAPEGAQVQNLDLHAKVMSFRKNNPGMSYADALKTLTRGG